jgi:hypothetical protein
MQAALSVTRADRIADSRAETMMHDPNIAHFMVASGKSQP